MRRGRLSNIAARARQRSAPRSPPPEHPADAVPEHRLEARVLPGRDLVSQRAVEDPPRVRGPRPGQGMSPGIVRPERDVDARGVE